MLLVPGAGALLVPGWRLLLVGCLLVLDWGLVLGGGLLVPGWGLLLGGEAPPPVLISGREVGLEPSSSSGIWCCWNMVLAFFSCGLASGSCLLSGEKNWTGSIIPPERKRPLMNI